MNRRTFIASAVALLVPAVDVDVHQVQALIAQRHLAQHAGRRDLAQRIERQLQANGVSLRDAPEGTYWTRAAA